ncbi:MAG: biotin--[acetyl-CoA-carboxylase] ligase [Sphingomonadales bacterium]
MIAPEFIALDGGVAAEVLDELDSTNAEALRRIRSGNAREGWIVARRQTGGRGRHGRAWVSEPGNLFASRLLKADCPRACAPELSFVTSLAVRDAARDVLGQTVDVTCKWPNDVLVGGAKVAGILLESEGAGPKADWVVIGVGVNVACAPENVMFRATSIRADGGAATPDDMLTVLHRRLDHWLFIWRQRGFAAIRDAWMGSAARLGETVTVGQGPAGITGRFVDLDADGGLVLELPDGGTRTITAGDVLF